MSKHITSETIQHIIIGSALCLQSKMAHVCNVQFPEMLQIQLLFILTQTNELFRYLVFAIVRLNAIRITDCCVSILYSFYIDPNREYLYAAIKYFRCVLD